MSVYLPPSTNVMASPSSSSATTEFNPCPLIFEIQWFLCDDSSSVSSLLLCKISQCFVIYVPNLLVSVEEGLAAVDCHIVLGHLGACVGVRGDLTIACNTITV